MKPGLNNSTGNLCLMSSFQSLDPPFSLLATTFRVDKDEQRMGVWHGADLLNDAHVLVI